MLFYNRPRPRRGGLDLLASHARRRLAGRPTAAPARGPLCPNLEFETVIGGLPYCCRYNPKLHANLVGVPMGAPTSLSAHTRAQLRTTGLVRTARHSVAAVVVCSSALVAGRAGAPRTAKRPWLLGPNCSSAFEVAGGCRSCVPSAWRVVEASIGSRGIRWFTRPGRALPRRLKPCGYRPPCPKAVRLPPASYHPQALPLLR